MIENLTQSRIFSIMWSFLINFWLQNIKNTEKEVLSILPTRLLHKLSNTIFYNMNFIQGESEFSLTRLIHFNWWAFDNVRIAQSWYSRCNFFVNLNLVTLSCENRTCFYVRLTHSWNYFFYLQSHSTSWVLFSINHETFLLFK